MMLDYLAVSLLSVFFLVLPPQSLLFHNEDLITASCFAKENQTLYWRNEAAITAIQWSTLAPQTAMKSDR